MTTIRTLVSVDELVALREQGDVLALDARFDLSDTGKGLRDYLAGHVPGAMYAHLDTDLSDHGKQGFGRHPLPSDAVFSAALSRWGWSPGLDVVVYDDASGAMAARLWWLLRLAGHERVAVLDGGLAAWCAAGLPLESGAFARQPTDVHVVLDRGQVVWYDELQQRLAAQDGVLVDARAAARYRGEVEPIDAVAGHVPGAVNRPFSDNLSAGRFRPAGELRREFEALLSARKPADMTHMCGSGVTACHNLLAMEHAGLSGSRVFAPSWSGWIDDPARSVAKGG